MTVMIDIPSYEPRAKVVSLVWLLGEETKKEILLTDDGICCHRYFVYNLFVQ